MFSNLLQTTRSTLNSLICVDHFSNNFNSVFHKKVHENYWCCSNITCQEKEQIGYLEYSLLMIIMFFGGQSDHGVTQLVIKPFGISQTSRIVGLR